MSLLGNAQRSALNIELSDDKKSWTERRTISSVKQSSSTTLVGNLKTPTKLILSVIPPNGGLVRAGGDYTVNATGAVKFDPPLTHAVDCGHLHAYVRTRQRRQCRQVFADGTLSLPAAPRGSGSSSTPAATSTRQLRQTRLSLKLIPGRGLVDPHDPTAIVFQRTH